MSYLFILLAGLLAGVGYHELRRRSFWEDVDAGCFHGCLIALGTLVAVVVLGCVIALRLNYWSHVAIGFGGFYGFLLLSGLLEYLEELWKRRKRKDDSS
jgi:hypothetical protein